MTTVPAEQKILFLITAVIVATIGLRFFKITLDLISTARGINGLLNKIFIGTEAAYTALLFAVLNFLAILSILPIANSKTLTNIFVDMMGELAAFLFLPGIIFFFFVYGLVSTAVNLILKIQLITTLTVWAIVALFTVVLFQIKVDMPEIRVLIPIFMLTAIMSANRFIYGLKDEGFVKVRNPKN